MTNGTNKKYAIDIIQSPHSKVYTLREPANESTIPFLFEVAQFIRDASNTERAIVKLRNNEVMEFGACGTTLSYALHNLYGFFIYGKRDHFLYIIERSKLDDDGNLEITINPKNVDRRIVSEYLSDSQVVAYQMEEIRGYFDIFVARNLLPEFLPMINASEEDAERASPISMQKKIGSMPIRFVTEDGRRVSIKHKQHPQFGSVPDLDFG